MAFLPVRLIILPLLLLLGTCSATLIRGGHVVLKEQKEFDFFTLSLSWSATACLGASPYCCSTSPCCRTGVVTGFTINGFWPDYNDGTWPSCCDGPKYDENANSDLSEYLNKYWPSYDCDSSSACGNEKDSYLAYEWEKHGTCATPVLSDQYDYFKRALMLYLNYNVTGALSDAGCVPSDSTKYPLEFITSAIQFRIGVTPVVKCNGEGDVKELQLCFNKKFQLQECPNYTKSKCPELVSLPIISVSAPSSMPKTTNYLSFRGALI